MHRKLVPMGVSITLGCVWLLIETFIPILVRVAVTLISQIVMTSFSLACYLKTF